MNDFWDYIGGSDGEGEGYWSDDEDGGVPKINVFPITANPGLPPPETKPVVEKQFNEIVPISDRFGWEDYATGGDDNNFGVWHTGNIGEGVRLNWGANRSAPRSIQFGAPFWKSDNAPPIRKMGIKLEWNAYPGVTLTVEHANFGRHDSNEPGFEIGRDPPLKSPRVFTIDLTTPGFQWCTLRSDNGNDTPIFDALEYGCHNCEWNATCDTAGVFVDITSIVTNMPDNIIPITIHQIKEQLRGTPDGVNDLHRLGAQETPKNIGYANATDNYMQCLQQPGANDPNWQMTLEADFTKLFSTDIPTNRFGYDYWYPPWIAILQGRIQQDRKSSPWNLRGCFGRSFQGDTGSAPRLMSSDMYETEKTTGKLEHMVSRIDGFSFNIQSIIIWVNTDKRSEWDETEPGTA